MADGKGRVLVTGSSGLVGSEAIRHYDALGWETHGIDNNQRAEFFGPDGDTTWNGIALVKETRNFTFWRCDIRRKTYLNSIFRTEGPFDLIIHAAAQPSHDAARRMPLVDFEVNALGTMHMLEAYRQFSPQAVFIQISTSKVYGDNVNQHPGWEETDTRYGLPWYMDGSINEQESIDHSIHSLFGASKLSGDIMAQEYYHQFKLPIGIFRPCCLTGPAHSAAEEHGFLAYLVKCAMTGTPYKIFGYKGKQVRDNLHSYDVITAFEEFRKNPRPGEVYNLGGCQQNSCSILEAAALVEEVTGEKLVTEYFEEPRIGDHRVYISDMSKFRRDYPAWKITKDLRTIIREIAARFQPVYTGE